MKKIFAIAALATLSACSSAGTNPIFTVVKEVVLPGKNADAAAPTSGSTLTRKRINEYGLALIRAQIEGEDITNLLTGTALNGRYVTYVSGFRQSITMLGSLVTGTRGLGGDLLAVRNDSNDPIAYATPVKNWPKTLTRDYRFPDIGPEGRVVSVTCELSKAEETQVTIVEMTYNVTPITEDCAGDGVSFSNTYLADTVTGQIWQTQQWVGEKRGYMNIEVLEPLTID